MKVENRRNILFRYGSIVFLVLLLCVRIVWKLVDNTVVSADKWNAKAEQALTSIDTIMPVRGDILACDGSILATNMRVYTPAIDFRCPRFRENAYRKAIPALADSMAHYFPRRTRDQWVEYLNRPLSRPREKRSRAFPLVRDISYAEAEMMRGFPFLKEKKIFTGFHVNDRLRRVRPYGDMARRSIGGVGVDSLVNVPYGKYGLERALDSLLAGTPGLSKKVPLTKAIVDWTDRPPIDGYDVLTTIDIKMQDMLENELNKVLEVCRADWGTALLMEVKTGDIKAIANLQMSPNPNEGYIECLNRAVLRYEPGSVVKTLSMLIMLEDGKIPDINREIETGGRSTVILGRKVSDHLHTTTVPISRALEYSSNIALSKMVLEFYGQNPGQFYTRIKNSGFLKPFNTGIAEEMTPRIDSLGHKRSDLLGLTRQSFGYGTEISPLYTAALYNAIANGGQFVRPRVVRGIRGEGVDTIYDVDYVNKHFCSPENAAKLRDMLHKVVWGKLGTANRVVPSDKVEIAGKTGTAKVIRPNVGYVDGVHRLTFCGFFPYDNPRYTCIVVVEAPKETWFSPEATSGRVVKNMAEGLYARGMLGNRSDYWADTKVVNGAVPTFYASASDRNDRINAALCAGGPKSVLETPSRHEDGVPEVLGLGLREALQELESAGYNVAFSGSGYVAGQDPAPGTQARQGSQITLLLKE